MERLKRVRISLKYLFELCFIFLLFQQAVFTSQMTFESLLLVSLTGIAIVFSEKGAIKLNPFLIAHLLLIVYAFEIAVLRRNDETVYYQIMLMLGGWLANLGIYNYLMKCRDIERFMWIYIGVAVVSMVIIWMLLGDRVISSRMGHNGSGAIVSYYIGSTPIYKSSNGTANICAKAILFLLFFICTKRKVWLYVPAFFLMATLLLCGSRKGLLVVSVYLLYMYFVFQKGITIKKVLILFTLPFLAYFVLYRIPIIYDMITSRVESLIQNLLGFANSIDGNSFRMRMQLQDIALKWIAEKPFLGHGINTFVKEVGNGAENNILQLLLNFGFIGMIIYYSFLIPLAICIFKNWKISALSRVFCVMIVTMLIQDVGSVSYSWQSSTMWYSIFWAVININRKKCGGAIAVNE